MARCITTVNSRYNQVGYTEITAYNEMEISPQSTKCINYYPLITNIGYNEGVSGPKHFVITRVHCTKTYLWKSEVRMLKNYIRKKSPNISAANL